MAASEERRRSALIHMRIRRIRRRLDSEVWLKQLVVPLWCAATAVALYRLLLRDHTAIFAVVAFAAAFGWWWTRARRSQISVGEAVVLLDRAANAGGLVLTRLERPVGAWELNLNERVRAAPLPEVRRARPLGLVALPYAPEFEPGSVKEGKATLGALARLTGGVERLSMTGLFRDAKESEVAVPLAPAMASLGVLLLLAEVFVRRFLSGRPQRAAVGFNDAELRAVLEPANAARSPLLSARERKREREKIPSSASPAANVVDRPTTDASSHDAPTATEGGGLGAEATGLQSALDLARERASRRTKR